MIPDFKRHIGVCVAAVLVALAVTGCVDEKKVFVERPLFEQPSASAAGFIGYTDTTTQKTVCGNCHVDHQAEWTQTKHASAWVDLQASGHASATCEPCHTVNSQGNAVTDPNVGFVATKDPRYHDVQCEACHGPGLDHVTTPDGNTAPLASIAADSGMTNGCAECHTGTHHPFVEEWQKSKHATLEPHVRDGIIAGTDRSECLKCHSAQGALKQWGVTSNYLEKNAAPQDYLGITCAVCHDPHSDKNVGQLRFSIGAQDTATNLCMKCHQREGEASPTNSRGPHSPEGPLLLGEAGWFPPNLIAQGIVPGSIKGTHGSEANPGLCATCHVSSFTVTDPTIGGTFTATGHLFSATPCIDPTTNRPTTDESCDITQRSFKACTASGCHGSEAVARSAEQTARIRIQNLVDEAYRLVALAPASEFSTTDGKVTTAEGTKFNAQLGDEANKPGSVVHNPFLVETLLTASIKQMQTDYGLTAAPGISLQNVLKQPGMK